MINRVRIKIRKNLAKKTKKELKEIIIKKIKDKKKEGGLTEIGNVSKNKILERDNHECILCGDKNDLQVHHFKPKLLRKKNYQGWRVTLCKYCHWYLHSNPKYRIYSSDLIKKCVRRENGITESYKGNKWGRKQISRNKMREVINLRNNNKTIREISKLAGVSVGWVHKIISGDNDEQ